MTVERLNKPLKIVIAVFTIIGLLMSINMLFYLELFGFNPIQNAYLYYILACFIPISFLICPAKKGQKVKWYDFVLAVISFIIIVYFALNGQRIIIEGWEYNAPQFATYASVVLWAILLEALRRTGGFVLSIIIFS